MVEAVVKVHTDTRRAGPPFQAYYKVGPNRRVVPGQRTYLSLRGYRGQIAMQGHFIVCAAGYEGQTPVIHVTPA